MNTHRPQSNPAVETLHAALAEMDRNAAARVALAAERDLAVLREFSVSDDEQIRRARACMSARSINPKLWVRDPQHPGRLVRPQA